MHQRCLGHMSFVFRICLELRASNFETALTVLLFNNYSSYGSSLSRTCPCVKKKGAADAAPFFNILPFT